MLRPFTVDLIGADVLSDAPGLLGRHIRLSNRIQQRCFPVIDVPHDGYDRRSGHIVGWIIGYFLFRLSFLFEADDLRPETKLGADLLGSFEIKRLVDGGKNALGDKPLDDVLGLDVHLLSQLFERHALGDGDGPVVFRRRGRTRKLYHFRDPLGRFHSPWFFSPYQPWGTTVRATAGLSSRRLFSIRSVISGVTTFSVLVRISIFVLALGTTIFLETVPGCGSSRSAARGGDGSGGFAALPATGALRARPAGLTSSTSGSGAAGSSSSGGASTGAPTSEKNACATSLAVNSTGFGGPGGAASINSAVARS